LAACIAVSMSRGFERLRTKLMTKFGTAGSDDARAPG